MHEKKIKITHERDALVMEVFSLEVDSDSDDTVWLLKSRQKFKAESGDSVDANGTFPGTPVIEVFDPVSFSATYKAVTSSE